MNELTPDEHKILVDAIQDSATVVHKGRKDMNERINGLWWKARIGYNNQNCDPEVLAKFAELIVGECAGIYDKIDNGNLHMGTDNYLEALHKTFWS
jgi:hypothetical protein